MELTDLTELTELNETNGLTELTELNRTNRINGANSLVPTDKIGSGSFNEINKNYQFGSLKIKEIL